MAKRHVLVTGATGQQGGAVARELLKGGHQVRALTRRANSDAANALQEKGAEIVVGDSAYAFRLQRIDDPRRAGAAARALPSHSTVS